MHQNLNLICYSCNVKISKSENKNNNKHVLFIYEACDSIVDIIYYVKYIVIVHQGLSLNYNNIIYNRWFTKKAHPHIPLNNEFIQVLTFDILCLPYFQVFKLYTV